MLPIYLTSQKPIDTERRMIEPWLGARGEGVCESEEAYEETMLYAEKWLGGGTAEAFAKKAG